jgi:hypothetical protein
MRPVSFRNRPRRRSMFDEHRLGNDGTEATLPRPPDDGDPEAVTIKRTKTMTTSRILALHQDRKKHLFWPNQ